MKIITKNCALFNCYDRFWIANSRLTNYTIVNSRAKVIAPTFFLPMKKFDWGIGWFDFATSRTNTNRIERRARERKRERTKNKRQTQRFLTSLVYQCCLKWPCLNLFIIHFLCSFFYMSFSVLLMTVAIYTYLLMYLLFYSDKKKCRRIKNISTHHTQYALSKMRYGFFSLQFAHYFLRAL